MTQAFKCRIGALLCIFFWLPHLHSQEVVSSEVVETPVNNVHALKHAKLTEEQVVNQLKYMMIKGFARVEDEAVKNGSFAPIGLTLAPNGEFKAVIPNVEADIPTQIVLVKLVESMEAIAKTRSMWAVGIMYIRAIKKDDGSYAQRIIVMTEHIAGLARHWAYPFKVEGGELRLGQPNEMAVEPIYYINKE